MSISIENICCDANDITSSNIRLTDAVKSNWRKKPKQLLKHIKNIIYRETTVEPCLFIYMMCISLSALAVKNLHLEKSCRVNYKFDDSICDRISDRNTSGLEKELNQVQSLVAKVVAWRFPLHTAIPALLVMFMGAWSDKTKKRKIFILFPMIGEIISNIGLLLATYYFYELSLNMTVVIEKLPVALTGGYIIIFMGMYSYMTDITTVENRTFRLGVVAIFVTLGTPTGTMLSGILLQALGYYGMFSLLLALHTVAFIYGVLKLKDIEPYEVNKTDNNVVVENKCGNNVCDVFGLVKNTVMVAFKSRAFNGRIVVLIALVQYIIIVGPLYVDFQVGYLYAIRKFSFTTVEYSIYGTFNIVLGLFGTFFLITVLSKKFKVQDSVIGGIAGVSRIASCLVFAFAPNRQWYYAAPVFNIFSHTGLTAVRSIATKSVPTEEVAKVSSLMGLMEGVAASIYNPISSSIYTNTIETFPGAFYMFDVALTLVAVILFIYNYTLVATQLKSQAAAAEQESKRYAKSESYRPTCNM